MLATPMNDTFTEREYARPVEVQKKNAGPLWPALPE
jgi:hypothetical protein